MNSGLKRFSLAVNQMLASSSHTHTFDWIDTHTHSTHTNTEIPIRCVHHGRHLHTQRKLPLVAQLSKTQIFYNFNDNFDVGFFHPYKCLMATTSLVRRLLPYLKSLNNNTELDVRTGSEYNL